MSTSHQGSGLPVTPEHPPTMAGADLFLALAPGLSVLTATGLRLRALVREAVRSAAGAGCTVTIELPPVVPASIAERADYLSVFPHLLGAVRSFGGGRAEQPALLRAVRDGTDWGALLGPTDLVLPPAACHGLYALLADSDVEPVTAEVQARCFRHEPSAERSRFQSFEMLEFVYVGDEATVGRFADTGIGAARAAVEGLGLSSEVVAANDPFFGVAAALLIAEQHATDAKREVVVDGPDGPCAVASVNRHGAHFGEAFAIRVAGAPAHSACIAFGIERLMLAVAGSTAPRSRELMAAARAAGGPGGDRGGEADVAAPLEPVDGPR
jgi:hypothetical protein